MYDQRIILLDADVILHFIRGGQLSLLPQVFDSKYWILKRVYKEVQGLGYRNELDRFISENFNVEEKELPLVESVYRVYAELEWSMGSGESAILALAHVQKHVVASSNVKDVKEYCSTHDIDWITTLDLLAAAYSRGLLSATDCDQCIQDAITAGSKLPNIDIQSYIRSSS